jgi:prepilin-type processing-associated H-X9-DG protein
MKNLVGFSHRWVLKKWIDMSDDVELLARFAGEGCETSFSQLVARHLDFVHAAALRMVAGDRHLAQDVAQVVFIDLARKAGALPRGVVLAGWLYEATRFAAAKAVRIEQRRRGEHAQLLALRRELEEVRAPANVSANPASGESAEQVLSVTNRVTCLNHVRQLCLAAVLYADDHQGVYPDARGWCDALQVYYKDAGFLRCPADPDQPCGYAFNARLSGISETNLLAPSDTVVFFEAAAGWDATGGIEQVVLRHGDMVNLGFADGSARSIRGDRLTGLIWDPTPIK